MRRIEIAHVRHEMGTEEKDIYQEQGTDWNEYLERISEIERTGIMYVSAEEYDFLCDMLEDNDDDDDETAVSE